MSIVEKKFLYYLLRATMARIRLQIHGATMKHITRPIFESIQVLIPKDKKEQQAITDHLEIKMAEAQRLRMAAERQFRSAVFLSQNVTTQA